MESCDSCSATLFTRVILSFWSKVNFARPLVLCALVCSDTGDTLSLPGSIFLFGATQHGGGDGSSATETGGRVSGIGGAWSGRTGGGDETTGGVV